mmetsp:Transcript_66899/g.211776  ORF Transcript_66899/g.211776 Transcript_66899/m.211776 type:complete len:317 (+) Transcript_66899:369-1319(+)
MFSTAPLSLSASMTSCLKRVTSVPSCRQRAATCAAKGVSSRRFCTLRRSADRWLAAAAALLSKVRGSAFLSTTNELMRWRMRVHLRRTTRRRYRYSSSMSLVGSTRVLAHGTSTPPPCATSLRHFTAVTNVAVPTARTSCPPSTSGPRPAAHTEGSVPLCAWTAFWHTMSWVRALSPPEERVALAFSPRFGIFRIAFFPSMTSTVSLHCPDPTPPCPPVWFRAALPVICSTSWPVTPYVLAASATPTSCCSLDKMERSLLRIPVMTTALPLWNLPRTRDTCLGARLARNSMRSSTPRDCAYRTGSPVTIGRIENDL